ncbi:hypothetical protein BTO23_20785 [Aliivibrio sifiae]|uniref:DDE domain-containing protein n=1 Tax=Aliivibrio sifiae TaxID=566293 RepID=A0A2S7X156_9GAMM|nr:hypothetical protein BTO23_20785 [Aliivibrio sifiae]GLR76783.1 hypothetical protein GCM10007855_36580 [Aliivibrio sifiae]
MDETYVKIKGEWWYYYRAVDKNGDVVDIKYLNNIVEQSRRPIKQKMVQTFGWKSEAGALVTMAGQETWTMIKRGQIIGYGSLHNRIWSSAHCN